MLVHNPLGLSADKLVLACTHGAMELNYSYFLNSRQPT